MKSYAKLISSMIFEKFGNSFDSETTYIIPIQGCSSSGKTTISTCFKNVLENNKNNCNVFLFNVDNFYKNDYEIINGSDGKSYDFDNPGALEWDMIFESLCSIVEKKPIIKYSKYNYFTYEREDIEITNTGFNVILVDGIFSHCLFGEKIFNYEEYDPMATFKQINEENRYKMNSFCEFFKKNSKILPIFMDLSDVTIIENRVVVDKARTVRKTREASIAYTTQFVLRSANEWIRSTYLPDSIKIKRDESQDNIAYLIYSISKFFYSSADVENIQQLLAHITNSEIEAVN